MPKTMDPDMQAFQAELLEAVRDMKVGRAARTTRRGSSTKAGPT